MQRLALTRRVATRRRIVAAAMEVFAEHGFIGATTRNICKRAQANSAAVNYHFGDKRGLYREVLKTLIVVERQHDLDDVGQGPPEDALRRFIEMLFRNVGCGESTSVYSRLMMHELAQPTAGLEMVVKQFIRPRADVLRSIVAQIIGEAVDSDRTWLCTHSIIGQLVYYFHARPVIRMLWPRWRLDEDMRQQMIGHFMHFSLAALHHMNDAPAALPNNALRRRPSRRTV